MKAEIRRSGSYNYVSPGYFQTLGTHLVAGRDFTWDDLNNLRPMVMVSENVAGSRGVRPPLRSAKRVKKYDSSPWQQVIGVVEDVRVHGVDEMAPTIIYWPAIFYDRFDKSPILDGLRFVTFVIHTSAPGQQVS